MSKNVYQKLQLARLLLQEKKLSKSGKNKFAGYEYFELQDFLPAVQTIFADTGLCAVFRCGTDDATLTVYNTENPNEYVLFTAPMAAAELKGCHPVQNLGASISYLRRYLYVNALEIVEHDALDATTGKEDVAPKAAPKPVAKPAPVAKTDSGANIVKEEVIQNDSETKISLSSDDPEWIGAVFQSAEMLLGFAKSESDVMNIYKRNKNLFERLKGVDAVEFKSPMDLFSKRKSEFKEAA